MNNFINKVSTMIFNRENFRTFFLIVCLFYFMPSLGNITNIPMKICFVWGVMIILFDFFSKRIMFKSQYWYLLLLVAVSFSITFLLNYQYNLSKITYSFVYMITSFFVIYPIDMNKQSHDILKSLRKFNNILVTIVFFASFISLVQFVFLISYHVPTGSEGLFARQGFMESRLFGIYTSPNIGSIFGFLSIIAAFINYIVEDGLRRIWKVIYMANLIVQILYFVLSSSRGTQLTVCVFLTLVIIAIIFSKALRDSLQIVYGRSIKMLIFFILGILLFSTVLIEPTKSILGYVPNIVKSVNRDTNLNEKREVDKVVIEHSKDGAELSSGRFTIWKAGLKAWKQHPFFGYGSPNFYWSGENKQLDESKLSEQDVHELTRARGNMHNGYLQVLVSLGVVGTVFIFIFYILSFLNALPVFFPKKANIMKPEAARLYLTTAVIFIFLISCFAEDLIEAHILMNNRSVVSLVFWYYLGLLSVYVGKERRD